MYQGNESGELPFYKVGDIAANVSNGNDYLSFCNNYISYDVAKEIKGCILPKDVVVFAKIGEALKLNRRAITSCNCLIDNNAMGIAAKPSVLDVRYFFYFMKNVKMEEHSESTTVPSVRKSKLENIEITVPDMQEQQYIAATLDKLQSIITHRKQQLAKLDELVKARFVEMFGDFKTNSMGWTIAKFTEIASIDGNMTTDFEKYANYPHIGIDSIEKDTGILRGYRTVSEDNVVSGKYVFTPSHIIYSKIRPNLNKVALPDFEGVCSADAYPILPNPENCNRVFLAYVMRSSYFLDYILQFCNRTNMPKVNRKEVSGFTTPLPPLDLQNQFATFVEQTDKSKVIADQSIQNIKQTGC